MTLLLSNEEIDSLLEVSMVLDAVESSQRAVAASEWLARGYRRDRASYHVSFTVNGL